MPTVQDDLRRDYGNEERQRQRIKMLETSKRELNVLKKEMQQMRLVVTVFNFQLKREFELLAVQTAELNGGRGIPVCGGVGGRVGVCVCVCVYVCVCVRARARACLCLCVCVVCVCVNKCTHTHIHLSLIQHRRCPRINRSHQHGVPRI